MMTDGENPTFGGIVYKRESENTTGVENIGGVKEEHEEEVKTSKRGRPRKVPEVDYKVLYGRLILRITERLKEIYDMSYSPWVKEKCMEILRDLRLMYELLEKMEQKK